MRNLLGKLYNFIFLIVCLILFVLSFFPILFPYVFTLSFGISILEFLRLGNLNSILSTLGKEEQGKPIKKSKILYLSITNMSISFLIYILISFVSYIFYINPLKKELMSLLKGLNL
ncbi:MAG: hypothetical protein ACK4UJ_11175 [Leptonema sp. (in: bacteria)]